MDLNVLNKLSTDNLTRMQAHIASLLESRLDTTLRIGRVGSFVSNDGTTRTIRITKINYKTVSGEETGTSINPGGRWRVGKAGLKLEPIERKAPVTPATRTARPATAGETW